MPGRFHFLAVLPFIDLSFIEFLHLFTCFHLTVDSRVHTLHFWGMFSTDRRHFSGETALIWRLSEMAPFYLPPQRGGGGGLSYATVPILCC